MKKDKKGIYLIIFIIAILVIGVAFWCVKKFSFVPVTFEFKEKNIKVKVGNKYTVNYELNKNIDIKWESEDTSIATIDNGVITANSVGSTIVKGSVTNGDEVITNTCYVTTHYGDSNVSLNDIIIQGEILYITNLDSYEIPIEYSPNNAYVESIDYSVTNPDIIDFNGKVFAKNIGTSDITITVNKTITKTIKVIVLSRNISPVLSPKIEEVNIEEDNIVLKPNTAKDIKYTIMPKTAFVENVKWSSSNSEIVSVDSGLINAKSPGEAVITLLVNDSILKEIKVKVEVPVTGLKLISSPKLVMKVGTKDTIKTSITPVDATNKKLIYSSSNHISINSNGEITAMAPGSGTITVKTEDGDYKVDIPYTINPKVGVINNAAGVWGYTSPRDKTPVRADANFFRSLASSGKGTFSNNVYVYSKGNTTYKYDLSTSRLSVNNRTVLMRIYYPQGVDLSTVNTFTFFGGSGERNFGGYFNHLDKNTTELSSSGIVILVSAGSSYYKEDGINATEFVKAIVGQTSGVTNAVGGYSMSGGAAGGAFAKGNYNRLVIFNSCVDDVPNDATREKEVIIYSPVGDSFTSQTINTLNKWAKAGYTNVIAVSNNSTIINNSNVNSKHLVINPGGQMGKGHGYVNISTARIFAYANR